jgi:hypothetical protein
VGLAGRFAAGGCDGGLTLNATILRPRSRETGPMQSGPTARPAVSLLRLVSPLTNPRCCDPARPIGDARVPQAIGQSFDRARSHRRSPMQASSPPCGGLAARQRSRLTPLWVHTAAFAARVWLPIPRVWGSRWPRSHRRCCVIDAPANSGRTPAMIAWAKDQRDQHDQHGADVEQQFEAGGGRPVPGPAQITVFRVRRCSPRRQAFRSLTV